MTRNKYVTIFVILIFSIISAFCSIVNAGNNTTSATGISDFATKATSLSKAAIVQQMNQLTSQIALLEIKTGITGKEGFIVYSSQITAKLYSLYQALYLRLHYLNYGNCQVNREQWDGYSLDMTNNQPYSTQQALQVMAELEQNGVPGNFIDQFHIFLLPYSITEISGLGGAGFTMISAASDPVTDQLKITLDHEIGHHIHLSFMPEDTAAGKMNWNEYLVLRGGGWHGPGKVNTMDWNNSSEETFAEDFRMLFGKDQPYYGDITLGDPRANHQQADNLKTFIRELGNGLTKEKYRSPWIPSGMGFDFWRAQGVLIPLIWIVIGFLGGFIILFGSPTKHI